MQKSSPKLKFCLHWLTLILPSSLQLSAFGAELSSEACRELGFSSNLLCSSCDLLGEFSLTKLQPDCRQCCQQEAQMGARKVKGATELRELAKRKSLSVYILTQWAALLQLSHQGRVRLKTITRNETDKTQIGLMHKQLFSSCGVRSETVSELLWRKAPSSTEKSTLSESVTNIWQDHNLRHSKRY